MFIEHANRKRLLLAPEERNASRLGYDGWKTSRSAGAQIFDTSWFYKHLAPLEPGALPVVFTLHQRSRHVRPEFPLPTEP